METRATLKSPVYLVQRLRAFHASMTRTPRATYIGDHFSVDYMGSAEFEFGALTESKKALCELQPETWGDPKRIVAPSGQEAWFVGPPERVMLAEQLLVAGLSGGYGHHTKEALYIFQAYNPVPGARVSYDGYIGWWAIDKNKDFAIFRHEADAKTFLRVLLACVDRSP